MTNSLTLIVALLCALALGACTSLRPVGDAHPVQTGERTPLSDLVKPGDKLVVTRADGKRIGLHVTATSADSIDGEADWTKKPMHLEASDISRIERRKVSPLKTTLMVTGVVAGFAAYAAAEATSALVAVL